MLHLIYKKLKKQKILLLTTSFLSLPILLVSCSDHHQEIQKRISKSLVPPQGTYNPKTADPQKGSPILEENSDIITNSVLGFNGQKKNPKVAKNRFDVTKNYTEEIPKASFILDNGGTGKYGLLPYWYYLQSIPKYLEKNNYIINNKYNKEEHLKRLEYFYTKIRDYRNRNLIEYTSSTADGKGEVEVWKQGLRNQYKKFIRSNDKDKQNELNIPLPADLEDGDKVDPSSIETDKYFPIIKPELDKYNAQIPDKEVKSLVVFDFLLGNQRIWPAAVDNVVYGADDGLDQARLFRDDLYIEKGYKPSTPEKLWYELGWFMLRPQRIISSANAARDVLEKIYDIEKYLFDLTDKNKTIDEQFATTSIRNFVNSLAKFLTPKHFLSLRKDLVFNIDISNNADDQSLISDFIEYYNQKLVPIIWRFNLKHPGDKPIKYLTKLLKDLKDDRFFNKYLAPYLPEINDLKTEEDIKNDQSIPEDKKEEAIKGAKKAGIKAWGIWLKNYQEKYGINFKPDPEIDQEYFDYSSLYPVPTPSVPTPESTETAPSSTLDSPSSTLDNTQQIPEQTEVINEESEPQRATVESQSEPVENTSSSNTQQPNNIQQKTEVIDEESEPQGVN
ncbi:hypothetical protein [Mesomycoplasma ovipneumoniae]|uniref:hypothetical protein n=1 Tax=Mesomycoplasma ovipneumoniae TaxID=29562 RepID=UPI00083E78D2|nr:hypothetical protein [Mesomycoplasma ovipneumoniae]